jgi:hypothetical protein
MLPDDDSSSPAKGGQSISEENRHFDISCTSGASTPEGLTFVGELHREGSSSATVFKTVSDSRVVIKRGLRPPISSTLNVLSQVSHPCLVGCSVLAGSAGTGISVQQEFRSKGSLETILPSVFAGTSPSF